MEERVKRGICALWKKPLEDVDIDMDVDVSMAPEATQLEYPEPEEPMHPSDQMLDGLDDAFSLMNQGSNNQQPQEEDSQKTNEIIQEALEDAERLRQNQVSQDELPSGLTSGKAEMSSTALMSMDMDVQNNEQAGQSQQIDEISLAPQSKESDDSKALVGLKEGSKDPTFGTLPESQDAAEWSGRVNAVRDTIASLPNQALWADLNNFEPIKNTSKIPSIPDGNQELSIEDDLLAIFADLQLYALPEIIPPDTMNWETKKKGDKKDKDSYSKRLEETTYSKLYPTGAFMHTKPTLISALQPSKKWWKGTWRDLDESPVASDTDTPPSLALDELSSCEYLSANS